MPTPIQKQFVLILNLIIFNFRNIEIVDMYQKRVNGLIHYLDISTCNILLTTDQEIYKFYFKYILAFSNSWSATDQEIFLFPCY